MYIEDCTMRPLPMRCMASNHGRTRLQGVFSVARFFKAATFIISHGVQGGPLPVIGTATTPLKGVITPVSHL